MHPKQGSIIVSSAQLQHRGKEDISHGLLQGLNFVTALEQSSLMEGKPL